MDTCLASYPYAFVSVRLSSAIFYLGTSSQKLLFDDRQLKFVTLAIMLFSKKIAILSRVINKHGLCGYVAKKGIGFKLQF